MNRAPFLGARHLLAPPHRGSGAVDVAHALVALHSTDPASVYLSVAARSGAAVADVDRALYEDGQLVRLLGMRRTVWVVPADLVPVVTAACTRGVAAAERRKLVRLVEGAAIAPDGPRWLEAAEADALAAVAERGEALGEEVRQAVPALRATYSASPGRPYERTVAIASRVLFQLAADGRIVRGRPRGTWLSSQYRWRLAPPCEMLDEAAAQAELARRWLAAFGPASAAPARDLQWWAGWTVAATKRALASAGCDGDGIVGSGGGGDQGGGSGGGEGGSGSGGGGGGGARPWAALLPGLDPTPMGWKEREWYVGAYGPLVFDSTGNVGPTVWWDGRIVGGWRQRPGGEVVTRVLEDIGRDGEEAVGEQAERLTKWLDGTVVVPRFRSPLDREPGP